MFEAFLSVISEPGTKQYHTSENGFSENMTREQSWLAVLEAVADACAAKHPDGAPTGDIARRLGPNGSPPARTLLRALRRRGYVCTTERSVDGSPLRWELTPAGRALVAAPRRRTGKAPVSAETAGEEAV